MRLIDADELYEKAEERYKSSPAPYRLIYRGFVDDIADEPTVDAVQVVYAKWINPHEKRYGNCTFTKFTCFNCGKESFEKGNFCPHCGAKMDM